MVCTRYISIHTDAIDAISDIDCQFAIHTLHAPFTKRMSNLMYYKVVSKALFSVLNKRRHINNETINAIYYYFKISYIHMYMVNYYINMYAPLCTICLFYRLRESSLTEYNAF